MLLGPPILAFLPALSLGAFWLGGEMALLFTSLGLPLLFALAGAMGRWPRASGTPRDAVTGLLLRDGFREAVARIHHDALGPDLKSACFLIELDDYRELVTRHGSQAGDLVALRSGDRIRSALRERDVVARLNDCRFAVCLSPVRQLDLELCIQLAGRIQSAVEDPISLDASTVYVSCSVGFCLSNRSPG
ncbi:GGDEF domain-containing protein, partial [Cribrihabitans sp. XS_ASV171]